ncbi:hypothetical protein PG994_004504 [Apiospora phragmitis]|uniref:Uncharacterized protein n=1 Tax=Apiospora phragmitis TaxID=2905665 RepID=A0ABR1VQS1_9PEZI
MCHIAAVSPNFNKNINLCCMYIAHAKSALRVDEQHDTKGKSDLSWVAEQYLMTVSSKQTEDSSLRVKNAADGALPGLLDARQALAEELEFGKKDHHEFTPAEELERKERNEKVIEVFKNTAVVVDLETREELDNNSSSRVDRVNKLRSRLELGKAYVENEDYKLAISVLSDVFKAGARSTPQDQLWYVSDAMESLETAYTKVNRDGEAYEIRKKKNKLDQYLGDWHKELPDWLPTRPA